MAKKIAEDVTTNRLRSLFFPLMLTTVAMIIIMSAFESARHLLFMNVSMWTAHALTVGFSTVFATLIAYFVLKKIQRLNRIALKEISERKQAEKMLQKERAMIATILDSNPHGIALIDKAGTYLYVNPMFTRVTGYTLRDVQTGKDWLHRAYPDSAYRRSVVAAWKKDSIQEGIGGDYEFNVTCKDGQVKDIAFRTTYLKEQSISVLTDVTDRNRAELALREGERLQGVLEMAGAICHEVNQPMQAILGYVELLMMNTQENSPLYDTVLPIKEQVERLGKITLKLAGISQYKTVNYLKNKIIDIDKASK